MKKCIVAIDGPAGSGKSTTAKLLASRLGYIYIDTGAMYRAITLYALRKNILSDGERICSEMRSLNLGLKIVNGENKIFLNDEDITQEIRAKNINDNVSAVSTIECVRKELVNKQRMLASSGGVVMEGRDIGTVVFPDADVKIFLTASIEKRAKRRYDENLASGKEIKYEDVLKNLESRDRIDSTRVHSPLRKAVDAFEVDNSEMSIDEQVEFIKGIVQMKLGTPVTEQGL